LPEAETIASLPARSTPHADPSMLVVDLAGFEGPIDLLLALARSQKVDLAEVSILDLADQYLAFLDRARAGHLEVAADYLVMAAWLAFLKSRLLLPDEPEDDEGPHGERLEAQLARRLQRLQAMREAAARLMALDRLGRDVFARGAPEGIRIERRNLWQGSLHDLLQAYADHRRKSGPAPIRVRARPCLSLEQARRALEAVLCDAEDWRPLESVLHHKRDRALARATVLASSFAASLELAREGRVELRQDPDGLFMRRPARR